MTWETRVVVREGVPSPDEVAVEEPLEIRVEGRALAVTLRTPGHDEELALGFLASEGVIEDRTDLAGLASVAANVVDCRLAAGVEAHRARLQRAERAVVASSACGLCGKTSLEAVRVRAPGPAVCVPLDDTVLSALPARLAAAQEGFRRTGGLHGAALLDGSGSLVVVREDVGRHNAVDKVLGWRMNHAADVAFALLVSSRAGFEIVQKARVAGLGTVVAVGAASTLAVDLAREEGMELLGFLRADGVNRYV
ncbi:MAG: formate dehydrogenase accessory sulfurtransferase FdhD [Myxococcales bacterium]|nr:formate dehydrogenase accessory sulfurtransferase FdhD [Myxococcales bacterium]